jgi:hypothetical protein
MIPVVSLTPALDRSDILFFSSSTHVTDEVLTIGVDDEPVFVDVLDTTDIVEVPVYILGAAPRSVSVLASDGKI